MYLLSQSAVKNYLINDVVSAWLDAHSCASDEDLVCHRWLRQTPAKRHIFNELYKGLLSSTESQRVLDVGGGLTGLTRVLATRHNYILADLLAHDDVQSAIRITEEVGCDFILTQDWLTLNARTYDLIIANDIFPNVDQRLEMFLQAFLPQTRSLRLSLTYYDKPRFYTTRRVDADEILCMLAWNGEHLSSVLSKYSEQIVHADFEVFTHPKESAFANGRQVCLVEMRGGLQFGTAS